MPHGSGEQPWHLFDEDIVWDWDEYAFGLDDLEELPDGRVRTRLWDAAAARAAALA